MMNRSEYLAGLEKELKGLAPEDRQNILAYYNEYLIDAEAEGQSDAQAILGSAHTLAAQIKADIAMGATPAGATGAAATTGGATTGGAASAPYAPGTPYDAAAPATPYGAATPAQTPQKQKSGMGVVWTVVLAILAIPVGIPLAIALFAIIIGVLAGLFGLLIGLGATVLAVLLAGIVAFVVGIVVIFADPATGVFYLGMGVAAIGLSLLFGIGLWKLAQLSFKGVAKLFDAIRKKLSKRERVAQ